MTSDTTNAGPTAEDGRPFKDWLSDRAADRGYDVKPGGGGRSALARAADVSPAQIGRALDGHAIPSTDTLRALAAPLGVTYVEMLMRAGVIGLDDMIEVFKSFRVQPGQGVDYSQYPATWPTDTEDATPEEIVAELGVTDPDDQAAVLAMVERLRNRPPAPKRDHRQRGVGGHPRPHTLKEYEQPGSE